MDAVLIYLLCRGESNILSCIPTSNIFIEAALEGGGVLVHCFGGKSRSPAFIAAYLMSSRSWTFDEAYNMIKAARPTVDINTGFERQLRAYGAAHYDVYLAQQLLLRSRIRALQSLRGNEQLLNNPDVKASERIVALSYERTSGSNAVPYLKHDSDPDKEVSPEETLLSSLSTGQKRSWVEDKSTQLAYGADTKYGGGGGGDDDDESMDIVHNSHGQSLGHLSIPNHFNGPSHNSHITNDQEESAAIRDLQRQQQHNLSSLSLLNSDGSSGSNHSVSFRSDSNSYSSHASDAGGGGLNKVPRANRRNRSSRSTGEDASKTPTCRLSRPGSNWVRVIPPLRGLEREFKCSWCNISLFSLANVIRVDLDVLPLLDIVKAEEKQSYSRKNTPRLDNMESPTEASASFHRGNGASLAMNPPTPRATLMGLTTASQVEGVLMTGQTPRMTPRLGASGAGGGGGFSNLISPRASGQHPHFSLGSTSQGDEMDIDEDNDVNDIASPKYSYPMKSTRGPGRTFDFDIPIINLNGGDAKAGGGSNDFKDPSSPGTGRGGVGSGNLSGRLQTQQGAQQSLGQLSARSGSGNTMSPKISARHHYEEGGGGSVSFASDSKPSGSVSMAKAAMLNAGNNSARGPPMHPSISSRPSSATSTSLYSYGAAGSGVHDDSPRIQIPAHRAQEQQDKRPQSAEKRRWLARVNLLREGGDTKAAKMADDDDAASQLGYGDDKYFHIEYLDWMGKDLFRLNNDVGDICCFNCHKAVGSYYWKPSVR